MSRSLKVSRPSARLCSAARPRPPGRAFLRRLSCRVAAFYCARNLGLTFFFSHRGKAAQHFSSSHPENMNPEKRFSSRCSQFKEDLSEECLINQTEP